MLRSKHWRSRIALMMTLGVTTTTLLPVVLGIPAMAQESMRIAQNYERYRGSLPRGTQISVYAENERVIVTPDETADLKLTTAEPLRNNRGEIVVPAGSTLEGELRPADGGTQFVAQDLILRGSSDRIPIEAVSNPVTRRQLVTRRSDPDLLRGAAIGSAAAAVLSEFFGRIDFIEVLAGAGLGVLGEVLLRRDREVEVVVVFPETDLDIRLVSDLYVDSDVRDYQYDERSSNDDYYRPARNHYPDEENYDYRSLEYDERRSVEEYDASESRDDDYRFFEEDSYRAGDSGESSEAIGQRLREQWMERYRNNTQR
ncbi:hypothetical protein ACQ4M4_06920 [Leptolyngbya sp. AN02str]|uniref:hypothetical protein n=1 Tax=Leptolyngbya sp. AN02str TaxID=3423363 RepID=UPI003D3209EF